MTLTRRLYSNSASKDFLVIGAYPPSGKYDECTSSEDHKRALTTIPKVGRPRKEPVYGTKDLFSVPGHRSDKLRCGGKVPPGGVFKL
jgi:hypothetical protein